jgi:hypothetical protein
LDKVGNDFTGEVEMTTKKAIFISAISVALTLMITLGLTGFSSKNNSDSQVDLALVNKIAEREASYRALLEEANLRIQALNAQITKASQGTVSQPLMTADSALAIANQAAGGDQVLSGVPQLVDFQGITAFEIPFNNGVVYVDASSGTILSSNVRTQINDQQAMDIAAEYLGITNSNTDKTTTHVVALGETISSIAFQYGKNMYAVLDANPGIDPYRMLVGSLVVIPSGNAFKVDQMSVNGSVVYKVSIANYDLFIDSFGTITKVQITQFAPPESSGSTTNVSSSFSGGED